MKINERARKVMKLRVRAGMLAILLLASAEFWMVCHSGRTCGQFNAQPAIQTPSLGELIAAR
jgi:hypothetical protein